MKIVFSIGGSVVAPNNLDINFIKKLAGFLLKLSDENQLAVVVGGGAPARKKIKEARERGVSEAECDHIGILATRENARALANELKVGEKIPETIVDAVKIFGKRTLVMGGTEPGHSTDAVAALIAEWVKADLLINATNVDGVFDKDPKEHSDAKLLKDITIDELLEMLKEKSIGAGHYALLDLTAAKVIQRSKIKTVFLNGRNLENMGKAVGRGRFIGTTVVFR